MKNFSFYSRITWKRSRFSFFQAEVCIHESDSCQIIKVLTEYLFLEKQEKKMNCFLTVGILFVLIEKGEKFLGRSMLLKFKSRAADDFLCGKLNCRQTGIK